MPGNKIDTYFTIPGQSVKRQNSYTPLSGVKDNMVEMGSYNEGDLTLAWSAYRRLQYLIDYKFSNLTTKGGLTNNTAKITQLTENRQLVQEIINLKSKEEVILTKLLIWKAVQGETR